MGQAELESDGINVFVIYDGKRIAERGWPDTPQAGTSGFHRAGLQSVGQELPARTCC